MVHRNPHNTVLLRRGEDEPWLGVQLLGSDPGLLAEATRMLAGHDFDLIDLNMGCPVPKVTKRGAGAALADDLDRVARCVDAVVAGTARPVTAKIRVLSFEDAAPTLELALLLAQHGVKAVTIHGRMREKYYAGPVAVDVIKRVREELEIPIIANGGIFGRAAAEGVRDRTGCSRLMVARGAIGNPWVFSEILVPRAEPPRHDEVCDELERQVRGMVSLYGESVGMRQARKIILAYLKGRGYQREFRRQATGLSTLSDFLTLLAKVRSQGPSPRFNPEHDGRSARQ